MARRITGRSTRPALLAGFSVVVLLTWSLRIQASACAGDCDGNGRVTIAELLRATTMALTSADTAECPAVDINHDGGVSVAELVHAVNAALDNCTCGNGVTENAEQCDDGNLLDGDGCSSACTLEPGGDLCSGIPTAPATHLQAVPIAGGLSSPDGIVAAPRDVDRLFVVEQTGALRIIRAGQLLPQPFLDVSAQVSCCGERGLLGLAFDPDYAGNGFFYIDYTDSDGNTVVARYHVSANPDRADPGSAFVILRQLQPFPNHNGGQLAFGPDGDLYVGLGDGGGAGDPFNNAQSLQTWLGKILRIDVHAAEPYAIPPDNPFAGGGGLPEIWAFGLRNPWRFSFDPTGGNVYIADVGQDAREEIDVQPTGHGAVNYGWRLMEGFHCFDPPDHCFQPGLQAPILDYPHDQGCAVVGGYVYRGCAMPELRGTYFYGDFCSNFVRSFVYAGPSHIVQAPHDWSTDLIAATGGSTGDLSSFGEDARGELYIATLHGTIFKIVSGG